MSIKMLSIVLLLSSLQVIFAQNEPVEILWDRWGTPHIFAQDNESLFYAFGYAQAQNHGNLILELVAEARGQAAEYGGVDFLENDKLFHTLGIPEQGISGYDNSTPEMQAYLDAFAQGITDYVATHPALIADEWEAVAPVTAQDVLAHGVRSLRYSFVAGTGVSTALNLDLDAPSSGSNAWAVSPERSASGNALLLSNSHQPWSDFGLWTEAHLVTPELNLYGASLVFSPMINVGFNEYMGWTHTVNTHDGWDVYALTITDDGEGYLLDSEVLAFEIEEKVIRVKTDDGFDEVPLTVRRSVHGTVLAMNADRALALRVVSENNHEAIQQWWEMGNARNLAEFEAALEPLRIPMFTVMYADRDGNILHVFNEQIPIRENGDWAFWNNTTPIDSSNPAIIPGDSSEYLWTEYHDYTELPRVLNPESGWLQNSNEVPWTTTLPLALEPADFPPYFAPPPFILPRTTASLRLLHADDSITFEEFVRYKFDTRSSLADYVLDDLIEIAEKSDDEMIQEAARILANWDRRADSDSVGAALFTLWAADYVLPRGIAALDVQWTVDDPLNTPSGISDPDAALASLETVVNQVNALSFLGISLDMPYGEVFRLRYRDSSVDLPASGGNDLLGTFSILTFEQDTDLRFAPVHGDSFIAAIEFSDPIRAEVLLVHGNSTQPGSPYVGDQLELFAEQQLREALITREQVETGLEHVETLTYRP